MRVPDAIELAVRNGAVPRGRIRGLTRDEVEKVGETNAHGQALPAAYEQFLIHAGRSFGTIGDRFQLCYPDVLEIHGDARESCARAVALLGESDVLFGQNIGLNWYWLRAGEPDPPVMCYSDLQPARGPVMVERSFSSWLEIVVSLSAPSA